MNNSCPPFYLLCTFCVMKNFKMEMNSMLTSHRIQSSFCTFSSLLFLYYFLLNRTATCTHFLLIMLFLSPLNFNATWQTPLAVICYMAVKMSQIRSWKKKKSGYGIWLLSPCYGDLLFSATSWPGKETFGDDRSSVSVNLLIPLTSPTKAAFS